MIPEKIVWLSSWLYSNRTTLFLFISAYQQHFPFHNYCLVSRSSFFGTTKKKLIIGVYFGVATKVQTMQIHVFYKAPTTFSWGLLLNHCCCNGLYSAIISNSSNKLDPNDRLIFLRVLILINLKLSSVKIFLEQAENH